MTVEDPIFPGGTGVSGLSVYPWEAEDGLCGGSPHLHLTCTEAYVVVGGEGSVQTLTATGLTETALSAGTVVWFAPGTIHRAVNGDGALRIVVLMQNSGLPEAGDAVFTFPPHVLADPLAYRQAAGVTGADSARARRDLAVRGFLDLADQGVDALAEFYRAAVALVSDRLDEWEAIWRAGALTAATRTGEQLAALRAGDGGHLLRAGIRVERAPETTDRRFGMCGLLDTYSVRPR